MALKDILLIIDTNRPCKTRLDMAINIAQEHQAHVTGLHIETHTHFPPPDGSPVLTLDERQLLFEQKISQAGLCGKWISVELVSSGAGTVEIVSQYAHYSDLVIVGQARQGWRDSSFPVDFLEQLLTKAGRPVLMVPYSGTVTTVGKRVLATWMEGPITTRALHDGMPFLEKAEHVTILAIDPPEQFREGNEQLRSHLARHAISARIEQVPKGDLSVGEIILNQATDGGSDLVIVGAKIHRSWVSLDLGPIVKYLLKHMTVPILVSC
jgi:nucleotide-binding universal stress UspA family protein